MTTDRTLTVNGLTYTFPRSGFVAVGAVRGWSGIVHRTEAAARAAVERDQRDCRAAGGYSDRQVYAV